MQHSHDKQTIRDEAESFDQSRSPAEQSEPETSDDQARDSEDPSQETERGSVKSTTREIARSCRSGFAELRQRMLSQPEEGYLACVQLMDTIDIPPTASPDIVKRLEEDTLNLYAAFNPRDPVESLLARQLVALGNASMGCFRRASCKSGARDMELGLGIKASSMVFEGLRVLDERRGRNQKIVNVGQVNVESGAQAFVGNVELPERQPRTTISPTSTGSDEPSDGKDC